MSHSQDGEIVEARSAVWNTEANAFRCVGLGMYASVIFCAFVSFVVLVKPVNLGALLAPRLHKIRSIWSDVGITQREFINRNMSKRQNY